MIDEFMDDDEHDLEHEDRECEACDSTDYTDEVIEIARDYKRRGWFPDGRSILDERARQAWSDEDGLVLDVHLGFVEYAFGSTTSCEQCHESLADWDRVWLAYVEAETDPAAIDTPADELARLAESLGIASADTTEVLRHWAGRPMK